VIRLSTAVEERQAQLEELCRVVFGGREQEPSGGFKRRATGDTDDEALAFAFRRNKKFRDCYHGDLRFHGGDQNRTDLYVCGRLCWWLGGDAGKIDAYFRRSALMRPKWDEKHYADGTTYGQHTIRLAVADPKNHRTPPPAGAPAGPGPGPAGAEWPAPLPIPCELPAVLPFDPAGLLPEAGVGFVSDVAERMQCPADYPGLALLVVLAGVVGAKLGIRPKRHDDWHVVPNLWGAVVGRPGVMKTPAVREALKFLRRLEAEAEEQYESDLRGHGTKLEVHEAMRKRRKDLIAAAVKGGKDAEKAAEEFGLGAEPAAPKRRRYLVNDSTVEKLGELLKDNVNGLVVFRDELIGLFQGLEKEGREGSRAFYLEAWDGGGSYTYDRIGRGTVSVPCLTLSVFGGVTPGRLADYLRGALAGGVGDDGLMQRLQLVAYPDVGRSWRNVDRFPETAARQRVWGAVSRLDVAGPEQIPGIQLDGMNGKYFLRFDDEAQQLFDEWRAALEGRIRSGDEHPAVESHLAKYRSLVPTLALLLHLADHDGGPVGAEATRKALAWAVYLESHMRRVYALGIDCASVAAKALGKRILAGDLPDGFRARDVYRKHWAGLSDPRAVNQALDRLLELHWLREEIRKTEGRDATHYRINPRLGKKVATPPVPEVPEGGAESGGGTWYADGAEGLETPFDDAA
jgi:putative DNA primase/helicase